VSRQATDLTVVTDFLRSVQRSQVDQLSELLGRGFPEWTTLHGQGIRTYGGDVPHRSAVER
jgi:hypothetical protein